MVLGSATGITGTLIHGLLWDNWNEASVQWTAVGVIAGFDLAYVRKFQILLVFRYELIRIRSLSSGNYDDGTLYVKLVDPRWRQ